MSNLKTKLQQLQRLAFWAGILLMSMIILTTAIGLPIHFANAKKRIDPVVTIHPKNCFQRTIRVTGDVDYKPFSYFHKGPTPHGYDIELVTELANRMEVNLDLKLMNWNDAVQSMQSRKTDIILGCDWQDSTVMDCNFTIPTFEEKFVVFQEEPIKSFSDLYRNKIAVIDGCGMQDTLKRYHLWQNCIEYANVTECVQAVLQNECNCFLAHHTIGEVALREFGDMGNRFHGRIDFASGQMCLGVQKDDIDLYEKVNSTLLALRADGTMDALAHKWLERFSEDITLHEFLHHHPMIFIVTANLAMVVIFVILIMNYYLIRIRNEKDRAIAAEQAKTLFFSTVSHDIRTPLNAIIGFSELLKNGMSNETERQNALKAITTSGNTLLELVNDILNLSKLETNKMVFNVELTDMGKLASSVLHSFDVAIASGKVKLVEDFSDMPSLLVDPHRIRQILFNLIGNAVKFTEQGEVRLKITFERNGTIDEGTGKLILSVSDTGYGISPENQKRLMQPFVQVQNPATKKGTGLGLYICRQLAMRMGGELTLSSELGKGSTFTMTLPKVGYSSQKPEITKIEIDTQQEVSKNYRVMVVDDVPINRVVIQAMLKRLNVTNTIFASNGVEALQKLEASPDGFDMILTDMWMPEMDGATLIGEIRKDERWESLPVYAVTADSEAQDTYKTFGFTGFLLKPVTLDKLRELLS